MRRVLYVSPSGTQWRVHWEKDSGGKYFDVKTEAIKYARKQVGQLKEGEVSQIRVQRQDGTFQAEWTYGKDPYPPKG